MGDEIIRANSVIANNVTNDTRSIVHEIMSKDKIMLTARRGKAVIVGVDTRNTTKDESADPRAIKDEAMMQDLALKFVTVLRRQNGDKRVLVDVANMLQSMAIFNVDCQPFYSFVAPIVRQWIPKLKSSLLLSI